MKRNLKQLDPFGVAWAEAHAHQHELSVLLLAVIVASPAHGITIANELGVTPSWWDDDGLRLIFCAADTLHEAALLRGDPDGPGDWLAKTPAEQADYHRRRIHDQAEVAKLARRGLRAARLWDARQPATNAASPLWSDASLAQIFDTFPGSSETGTFVRRTAEGVALIRDAEEHLRYAWHLVEGHART